jgi:hypothetical protein
MSAAGKIAGWLGASPETQAQIELYRRGVQEENPLPTSAGIMKAVEPVTGPAYQPKTLAGRVAETMTSLLPGMGRTTLTRGLIAPTIGIEAGGEIGKAYGGDEGEAAGRLIGGLGASMAPGIASRAVTGAKLPATRADLAKTLTDEGIDVTTGQVTGRKGLQYLETGPFEGKPASIAGTQASQFTRAALKKAGIDADNAGPATMAKAYEDFGTKYDDLISKSGGAPLDSALETDLLQTVDDFHRLKSLPPNAPTAVNAYFKRISDAARDNGGVIPADVFKTIRSDISRNLRSSKDPEVIQSLRQLQDNMFDSIGRNGPPDIVAEWKDVNSKYRNYKIIEKAMGGAGEATAEGYISPAKLRAAAEASDRPGYVRGKGDFADLARAGEAFLKPLPQSGTTARGFFPAALGAAGLAATHGDLKTAASIAAASSLPALASKALTARPVRTTLVRNVSGQGPRLLDPVTAALLARQAEIDQRRER